MAAMRSLVALALFFVAAFSAAATVAAAFRTSRLAAWLLVPYLSWVAFAAALNAAIWALN